MQAKLTVGRAGDRYEREADAVAERVSRGQVAPTISRIPPGGLTAQRESDESGDESAQTAQLEDDSGAEERSQALPESTSPDEQSQAPPKPTNTGSHEGDDARSPVQRETEAEGSGHGEAAQGSVQRRSGGGEDGEGLEPGSGGGERMAQTQLVQRTEGGGAPGGCTPQGSASGGNAETPAPEAESADEADPCPTAQTQRETESGGTTPQETSAQAECSACGAPQRMDEGSDQTAQAQCPACGRRRGSSLRRPRRSLGAELARARERSAQPLPADVQVALEPLLGAEISNIRVHTGAVAARLCKQLGARAFTSGNDIFFAPGRYDPHAPSGRRLLLHETTHAIQQGAIPSRERARPEARPPAPTPHTKGPPAREDDPDPSK